MTQQQIAHVGEGLSGDHVVDPAHSRVGFVARHAMVTKVRGHFATFQGHAHIDFEDPGKSSAYASIDVASIDTGNADRDAHLRTNDFFDAPNHPQMTFVSTSVEPRGDNTFHMTGDLTMKGATRPVTVEWEYLGAATDPFGKQRLGFSGRSTINRRDWGVEWNAPLEAGGVLVGDTVQLELDVSAVRTTGS
jgi:polyisoprenoid-binding protein YceI